VSTDTWNPEGGETTVEHVLEFLRQWLGNADGITISGGEPFDQPEALICLVSRIRETCGADILVYSGHPLEAVAPILDRVRGLIDAVITDPLDLSSPQTRPLTGSDNQRLTALTELGRKRFSPYERALSVADKTLDAMFDEATGEIWFAGVPRRGDFRALTAALLVQGHLARTAEDKRRR
jgi:anaerobic ribonucleoside-triphosphate reductase activating protein